MDALVKALQKTGLFAALSEEVLRQDVLPHRQVQEYRKGELLIEPRQQVNRFGVILSGKVHILHISPEGNYSLMSVLTAGEILGADLICTRTRISPYHAAVAAPARVVYFPTELITHPGFIREPWRLKVLTALLTLISHENMKKEYRLAILTQKGLRQRIVTYLTMQAARLQKDTFSIPFSREELAAFLCVNRSALSHELSKMQLEGLLTFRKNVFTLHIPIK